jgi:hypothetical protein
MSRLQYSRLAAMTAPMNVKDVIRAQNRRIKREGKLRANGFSRVSVGRPAVGSG